MFQGNRSKRHLFSGHGGWVVHKANNVLMVSMHAPRSHYALLNVCFRLKREIMTTVNIPAEVTLYIFWIFLISDIRTWDKGNKNPCYEILATETNVCWKKPDEKTQVARKFCCLLLRNSFGLKVPGHLCIHWSNLELGVLVIYTLLPHLCLAFQINWREWEMSRSSSMRSVMPPPCSSNCYHIQCNKIRHTIF